VAISGRLLHGPVVLASTGAPLAALADAAAPVAARSGQLTLASTEPLFHIPAGVWPAAAIVVLVLVGWLIEGRKPLPDWR